MKIFRLFHKTKLKDIFNKIFPLYRKHGRLLYYVTVAIEDFVIVWEISFLVVILFY